MHPLWDAKYSGAHRFSLKKSPIPILYLKPDEAELEFCLNVVIFA